MSFKKLFKNSRSNLIQQTHIELLIAVTYMYKALQRVEK